MNIRDARLIVALLRHLDTARMNEGEGNEEAVADFLEAAEGTAGTGACICPQSPEQVRRMAALWHETFETVKLNILLDHRCPHHGEKAQPALWGRHKEKVLEVKAAEWLSLGITHEVQP